MSESRRPLLCLAGCQGVEPAAGGNLRAHPSGSPCLLGSGLEKPVYWLSVGSGKCQQQPVLCLYLSVSQWEVCRSHALLAINNTGSVPEPVACHLPRAGAMVKRVPFMHEWVGSRRAT